MNKEQTGLKWRHERMESQQQFHEKSTLADFLDELCVFDDQGLKGYTGTNADFRPESVDIFKCMQTISETLKLDTDHLHFLCVQYILWIIDDDSPIEIERVLYDVILFSKKFGLTPKYLHEVIR